MTPEDAGFSTERLDRLSQYLRGFVDRGELPFASAVVWRQGQTVFREKYGWQEIETHKPVQFDTILRIMSMTKPITAVAAMLLYEEGLFDLNTPVSSYLPAFKDMKVLAGVGEDGKPVLEDARYPITFRHLFTHTSGISYGFLELGEPIDAFYQKAFAANPPAKTIQEFAAQLADLPLAFQPGTRWMYGFNQDLLGALVEVISGMPLADFFRERIFIPLGMCDTGFDLPPGKLERLAGVYSANPQGGALIRRNPALPMPANMWGGGGLVSTLDDYARFCEMLANRGRLGGVQLLSPTTVAMFSANWANPEALPSFWDPISGMNAGYGFSLGTAVLIDVSPTGKYGSPGEFQWGGAFSTCFWIDPKETLYAVFMTQLDPNWTYPIPWRMRQLVYQAMV